MKKLIISTFGLLLSINLISQQTEGGAVFYQKSGAFYWRGGVGIGVNF